MPFTKMVDRINALMGVIKSVGDLCFLAYRLLKIEWDNNKRWTTAHNQYKRLYNLSDEQAAKELAWWVFFVLHVIPYELDRRQENGDVYAVDRDEETRPYGF